MKKGCLPVVLLVLIVALLVIFAGPDVTDNAMRMLYPKSYSDIVTEKAKQFELDENLVYAVIKAESGFDADARSSAGAVGLMQLTPQTFDWILEKYPLDVPADITNPYDNIHAGCSLLRLLFDYYGDFDVVLSAYNAGMGNASNWLADERYSSNGSTLHTIPFPETSAYVKKVRENYMTYQKLYR